MMLTETMHFGDGSWWTFRTKMSHGTRRAMDVLIKPHLQLPHPNGEGPKDISDLIAMAQEVQIDWKALDAHALNDVMLLGSTTEWSYGAVKEDVLKDIPEQDYQKVLARLNELYSEIPLALSSNKA